MSQDLQGWEVILWNIKAPTDATENVALKFC
jgi:hypothetical protein